MTLHCAQSGGWRGSELSEGSGFSELSEGSEGSEGLGGIGRIGGSLAVFEVGRLGEVNKRGRECVLEIEKHTNNF